MDTVKFSNAIQLEEITHFQRDRPTKSILSTHKKFRKKGPKKVTYQTPGSASHEKLSEDDAWEGEDTIPIAIPGSSHHSNYSLKNETIVENQVPKVSGDDDDDLHNKHYREFSDDSSSDNYSNSDSDRGGSSTLKFNKNLNGGLSDGDGRSNIVAISDENLFPLPSIQVTKADFVFSLIAFLINFGELAMDLILIGWHYQNGQKWASGLTTAFVTTGGIGLLYQFGLLQPSHLDRLFRRGKRVRILVSCFPPTATFIVSYHSTMTAWKAIRDPMISQQYFKVNEFLLSLSRIQSFFQAAPQATLQLVVLLENFNETSWEKAMFMMASILVSLTVMTNANLPSKMDVQDDNSPSKAAYIPLSRMFMGLRMFSSLGSRTMALTYLLIGCRCLLQPDSTLFSSTMIALALSLFPRLIFTLTDYFTGKVVTRRNLERYREQPEVGISSSQPIERLPFVKLFMGYVATIFFPVGDPLWLFWYLWCESGIFIIFGNVAGSVTKDCLDPSVDGIFTGVFIIVFIIVPIVIPYVRAVVQRYKVQRFMRVLQVVEDRDESCGTDGGHAGNKNNGSRPNNNHDDPTEFGEEMLGINDNPNYDPGASSRNSGNYKVGNPFDSFPGLTVA